MKHIYLNGAARAVVGACLAAGALAACNQNGNPQSAPAPSAALPMEMTATAAPIAPAPSVSQLPAAPPVQVGRLSDPDDTYAYADEAYSENDAFGDAPPDYGFDYDGTRPWVWYGDDQSERVCEPLPGGGYRYYYYQPGAQYPYLVRDPDYSYGYDSGALVIVYDRNGRALPANQNREQVEAASRILARAVALNAASRQQPHRPIVAANWQARQGRIAADNTAWTQAQSQQSGWAAYHAAHAPQEQAQVSGERYRREAAAARFAQATNQPQAAQRDWQAAQQAHTQAPVAAPGILGVHPGSPKPPTAAPAAPVMPAAPATRTAAGPGARPAGEHAPPAQTAAGPAPAGPPAQAGGGDHRERPPGSQGVQPQAPRPQTALVSPHVGAPAAPVRPAASPSGPSMRPAPAPPKTVERTTPPPAAVVRAAPPHAPPPALAAVARPPAVHAPAAPPPVTHAAPVVHAPPPAAVVHTPPPVHPPAAHAAPPPKTDGPKSDDKHPPQ